MIDVSPEAVELAEGFVRRNASELASIGKRLFASASKAVRLRLPDTYEKYITSVATRYGRSKSFFFRSEPTEIYDFYVPLGVTLSEEKIPEVRYSGIISLTKRAVVIGVAGSGKSMLMRHILLTALKDGNTVPVFIELRNGNEKDEEIVDLIRKSLAENDFDLGNDFIDAAMVEGHFAILLDGYDEIVHSRRRKVTRQILDFSRKMPNCTIMVSSRPDDVFSGWQEFSILQLNPLDLEEASELVGKLPYDDDLREKFLNPHFPSIVDIQCGEKAILL